MRQWTREHSATWPFRLPVHFPVPRGFRSRLLRCLRPHSAAAPSIWDRGEPTGKSRSPSRRSQPTISAPAASTIPRVTPPAAKYFAKSGKTEEALAEFDRALAVDPYNVQALYGRALLYQGEKQHQQAIADFTAANGLSPQKVEPLLGRATSYLALDKAKEAAADLDEAVQTDPNSANAWSVRGQAYERLGDKAKAAESYGRALTIRPKDEAARSGLTRVGGKAG